MSDELVPCPTCGAFYGCRFVDTGNAMPYYHSARLELMDADAAPSPTPDEQAAEDAAMKPIEAKTTTEAHEAATQAHWDDHFAIEAGYDEEMLKGKRLLADLNEANAALVVVREQLAAAEAREALREKPWHSREIWATMKRAEPAMRDELMAAWAVRDDLLAQVARIRALCDEWEQRGMEPGAVYQGGNAVFWTCGSALRAVVGTQAGEQT